MAPPGEPRGLDRASAMPLWAQLRDELTRRVALGAFDEAFPGENELVELYGVSRHTVREALRRLRSSGVLDSGRGRATRVRRGIEQPLGTLYSLFQEVEARGLRQTSRVLDQGIRSDREAAAALGLPPGALLFHLERVRLAGDEPLAHDRVWMPADLAAPLAEADFGHSSLYGELAARAGVRLTCARERITAGLPSATVRAMLELPDGEACLRVERIGSLGDRVVEHRLTDVRGDRYALLTNWTCEGWSVGASTRPSDHAASSS